MDLATARTALDRERARLARARVPRSPPIGTTWRPTPTPYEANLRAISGVIPSPKVWDTSPVDPSAFDPTQPPSPGPPPANTTVPFITALTTLEVGEQLVCSNGTWAGASAYARQWSRAASANCALDTGEKGGRFAPAAGAVFVRPGKMRGSARMRAGLKPTGRGERPRRRRPYRPPTAPGEGLILLPASSAGAIRRE
jgi:hypothetical protein